MLFVGGRGLDGDGRLGQLSDQPHSMCTLCLDFPVGRLFGQSLLQQSPDSESDQGIGQDIGLEQTVEQAGV
jgi:hypothetical protein